MELVELLPERLLALVKNCQWSQNDAVELFIDLIKQCKNRTEREVLIKLAKNLYQVEIHQIKKSDLYNDTDDIECRISTIVRNTKEKTLKEILEEIKAEKDIDDNTLADVKDIVSSVLSWPTAPVTKHKELKETLFKLCNAVNKIQRFKPRTTQMVSWCILVLSGSSQLIQVGTGEGKSCIVAMFAAYRASIGECVDIISSSPVLSERDFEEWHPFYKELKITVGVNTNKKDDHALRKCYECKVVYGTTQNFAGDWLRHFFHRKNVRPGRKFQCVIVDEVDSLILDKGLDVVYLNSEMPVMQALNVILAEIWFVVNQSKRLDSGETLGLVQPFSEILSESLQPDMDFDELSILQIAEDSGFIPTGSTQRIRENKKNILQQLEDVSIEQMVTIFDKFQSIFPQYRFKMYTWENGGTLQELNTTSYAGATHRQDLSILMLGSGLCQLIFLDDETLHKSLEKKIKKGILSTVVGNSETTIPGFLEHISGKLQTWIKSAIQAKAMTLGQEYVLHMDGVVPVDYRFTGVVENNMKWGDGLQQFLEMKHQTRLTSMCVITNFKSNVSLFRSYKNQIYGVTGTLGNKTELEMLQNPQLYSGIKTCKIPSFKPRKLYEVKGIVTSEEEAWVQKICTVVKKQVSPTVYRGPRAAMVICETINRAEIIYKALEKDIAKDKLKKYINNNMDNSLVTKKIVKEGHVIIATNLAGRGTDLKVSPEVNKAGGLFVVQSFLPLNIRVEQQAFGRTARQGEPGSAQLIMCSTHFSESLKLVIALTSPVSRLLIQLQHLTSTLFTSVLIEYRFAKAFKTYMEDPNDDNCNAMKHALRDILSIEEPIGPTHLDIARQARDTMVHIRLSGFLKDDMQKILKKEKLFLDYLETLDNIYKQDMKENREDIVSSLHECWGMWLLMKFNENESIETLRQQLKTDLQNAKEKLLSKESPSTMVYHYIRSGNRLRHNGNFAESIDMYTRAIDNDPCWTAIALYNRAISILRKKGNGYIAQALADLEKANEQVEAYMKQLSWTHTLVQASQANIQPNINNNNPFTKQFKAKHLIQELLQLNIQEAVQKLRLAENRSRELRVNEKDVMFLFLQAFLVTRSEDVLRELVSLRSLGLDTLVDLDTTFSITGFLTKVFR